MLDSNKALNNNGCFHIGTGVFLNIQIVGSKLKGAKERGKILRRKGKEKSQNVEDQPRV